MDDKLVTSKRSPKSFHLIESRHNLDEWSTSYGCYIPQHYDNVIKVQFHDKFQVFNKSPIGIGLNKGGDKG